MRSMEEKIGYRLFMMGFLGLVCTAALCIFVFHKAFIKQAWQALEHQTALIAAIYQDDPQNLEDISPQEIRLTLISPSGEVLYETATDQQMMDNHIDRPEIQQALESGVGQDIRDSQTMGFQTYYYAQRLADGNVLRIAQDSQSLWSIYDEALPAILLSCLLMMGIAALTAGILTRTLIQPVLKMTEDLDHIQENVPYRELAPFAEAIHSDRVLRENNEKMGRSSLPTSATN